jgi:phosphoglycolate phosphatase-like HAD superfamily hydrolase
MSAPGSRAKRSSSSVKVRPRSLSIGDTPYDAEAAGKAGLRTIGFRCGGFAEAGLRDAGCFAIYDGPADLLARYDESAVARREV